jgi:hypothetical protein
MHAVGEEKVGQKEWYLFYQKDRKYPTGLRANRATEAGYWKVTDKDKEVYKPTEGEGVVRCYSSARRRRSSSTKAGLLGTTKQTG